MRKQPRKNPIGSLKSIPLRSEKGRPVVGYGKTESVTKCFSGKDSK